MQNELILCTQHGIRKELTMSENKTFPSYINFAPGEEAAEANRAWQGCPSVAVTRAGRLFAAWYTGGVLEPCIHNFNVLVVSDDRGESWSKPILTVLTDEKTRTRNIDMQLWITEENHLWAMWTRSPLYNIVIPQTEGKHGIMWYNRDTIVDRYPPFRHTKYDRFL